jgi:hypothetical protein
MQKRADIVPGDYAGWIEKSGVRHECRMGEHPAAGHRDSERDEGDSRE